MFRNPRVGRRSLAIDHNIKECYKGEKPGASWRQGENRETMDSCVSLTSSMVKYPSTRLREASPNCLQEGPRGELRVCIMATALPYVIDHLI